MAKKTETKTEKIEREYIIPLREKSRAVPRYKKTPKAIKTIKEFLVRHMKIYDKDLKKIKIDKYLNEQMWFRGIKKHPHKIKVKAIKDGDIVRVEIVDYPDKLKFKKLREEKLKEKAEGGKKKKVAEKDKEETKVEKTEEQKIDEKEKIKSVEESMRNIEKQKAKQMRHEVGGKRKQKTQPIRKALAK